MVSVYSASTLHAYDGPYQTACQSSYTFQHPSRTQAEMISREIAKKQASIINETAMNRTEAARNPSNSDSDEWNDTTNGRLDNQQEGPLDSGDESFVEHEIDWAHHSASLSSSIARLEKPVLVPQEAASLDQPFTRAWAPTLAAHGVQRSDFLAFIDHLNICKSASPPMAIVKVIGMIYGLVPLAHAPLIGMGIQAAAAGGDYAVARTRIALYLKRANKEYFAPRRLRVRIGKQADIAPMTGEAPDAALVPPLPANTDIKDVPKLRDRRLAVLGNRIAPLEILDPQDRAEEGNWVDRMAAKQAARKTAKKAKKLVEEQGKVQEKMDEAAKKAIKVNRKADKEARKKPDEVHKIEKERAKEMRKLDEDVEKERKKVYKLLGHKDENKGARKLLWIMVEELRDDEVPE